MRVQGTFYSFCVCTLFHVFDVILLYIVINK